MYAQVAIASKKLLECVDILTARLLIATREASNEPYFLSEDEAVYPKLNEAVALMRRSGAIK